MKLVLYYSLFAVLAIFSNFLTQELILKLIDNPNALFISIFVGTLVGLLVKYSLDKRYIFKFVTVSKAQNMSLFTLYSCMGVITTTIFWLMELSFLYIFGNEFFKYLGGFLGLCIGYTTKYYLDKKFVFVQK